MADVKKELGNRGINFAQEKVNETLEVRDILDLVVNQVNMCLGLVKKQLKTK